LGIKSFPKKQRRRGRRKEAYQKQQQLAGRNIEGVSILTVETIHKIMIQGRGDRGIEFRSRDHSQIDGSRESNSKNILVVLFLGGEIIHKIMVQEKPQISAR